MAQGWECANSWCGLVLGFLEAQVGTPYLEACRPELVPQMCTSIVANSETLSPVGLLRSPAKLAPACVQEEAQKVTTLKEVEHLLVSRHPGLPADAVNLLLHDGGWVGGCLAW